MKNRAQSIINLLIMGLVGLVFLQQFGKEPGEVTPVQPQPGSIIHDPQNAPGISLDMLLPQLVMDIKIDQDKEGTGEPAMCGQTVAYHFKDTLPDGTLDKEGGGKVRVRLGARTLASKGHELGLLGMKEGGVRTIRMPIQWSNAADAKNYDYMKSELTLISAPQPNIPKSDYGIRQFIGASGIGQHIFCGDKVETVVSIWSGEGKLLYQTPAGFRETFTPGLGQVFFGLEQAVLGMRPGGQKTVIIPPEYLMPLNPQDSFPPHPALAKWDEKQVIIVDLSIPTDYKPGAE